MNLKTLLATGFLMVLALPAFAASSVTAEGSTSMEHLIGLLGEAYEEQQGVTVNYNPTGSGAGISAVAEGRCDLGLSSRELKEEEKAGGLTAHVLAYDGIAVIVNPANPLTNLSMAQVADLFTGKIDDWNDLGWEGPVVVLGREAGSGTRDGFESIAQVKDLAKYRQVLSSTGDVVATVASNKAAIGYVSLAALNDQVKALHIDEVAPTKDAVKSGEYKMQRPFIAVTGKKELTPEAQSFLDFATSDAASPLCDMAGLVSPH